MTFNPDDFAAPKAGFNPDDFIAAEKPTYAQAVAGGFNTGAASLFGLPMKAVMDLTDLAKAGIGSAYMGVTGNPAPDMLQPRDRSEIPLTPEWFNKGTAERGNSTELDPNATGGQKALYRAVNMLTGVSPTMAAETSILKLLAQTAGYGAAGNAIPALAEQIQKTGDAIPNSPIASQALRDAMANILPMGISPAGVNSAQNIGAAAMLGGKRKALVQALNDAKKSGDIPMTVGQATGIPFYQGIENIGGKSPIGGATYKKMADAQASGMQRKLNDLAEKINPARGDEPQLDAAGVPLPQKSIAGSSLAQGLKDWSADTQAQHSQLHNDFFSKLPEDLQVQAPATVEAAKKLQVPLPNDSQVLNDYLNKNATKGAVNALLGGIGGTPDKVVPSVILDSSGRPAAYNTVKGQEPGLTLKALNEIKKDVGSDIGGFNPSIQNSDLGKLKTLYGPMAEDLKAIAGNAGFGEQWANYQNTVKKNSQTSEQLQPYQEKTPEGTFAQYQNDYKNEPTRFSQLNATLDPESVAPAKAEILAKMGKAPSGLQDAEATKFNINRFVTNAADAHKTDPYALARLLKDTPVSMEDVSPMLNTAERLKDSGQWLSNNSNTANVAHAQNVAADLGSAAMGHPGMAAKTMANALTLTGLPKLMTNQNLIKRMVNGNPLTDSQRLAMALMTEQQQQEYLDKLSAMR